MKREIKLDGGEITILKTIGLSGSPIYGKLMLDRIGEVQEAEFIDTLAGLIAQDYVLSSKVNVRSMEDVETRYREVAVHPDQLAAARALHPIYERPGIGQSVLLFDRVDRQQLTALGDVRTPSIADLFVAVMGDRTGQAEGAVR